MSAADGSSAAAKEEQVLLEVAAIMMAQQYALVLQQLHEHLLGMQDRFHDGYSLRRNEFELACTMAAPTVPIGQQEGQDMAEKLTQVIEQYRSVSEQEVRHFHDACFEIQQLMRDEAFKVSADYRAAERKRQDELSAAQQLAQREVSATVALVKSEQAQSGTEVTAMQRLREALEASTSEVSKLRAELETVRAEASLEATKLRGAFDEERASAREAIAKERTEANVQMRRLLDDADGARRQHLQELADVNASATDSVSGIRLELQSTRSKLESAMRAADEASRAKAEAIREHANERLELTKTITSLEYENERLKMIVDTERLQSNNSAHELRRAVEVRKNVEVEDFKRRLMGSLSGSPPNRGGGPSAPQQNGATPQNFTAHASPSRNGSILAAAASGGEHGHRTPSASPRLGSARSVSYQDQLGSSSPSQRGGHYGGGGGGSSRGASTQAAGIAGRSPSETFTRLQHLSSQWKDRVASL